MLTSMASIVCNYELSSFSLPCDFIFDQQPDLNEHVIIYNTIMEDQVDLNNSISSDYPQEESVAEESLHEFSSIDEIDEKSDFGVPDFFNEANVVSPVSKNIPDFDLFKKKKDEVMVTEGSEVDEYDEDFQPNYSSIVESEVADVRSSTYSNKDSIVCSSVRESSKEESVPYAQESFDHEVHDNPAILANKGDNNGEYDGYDIHTAFQNIGVEIVNGGADDASQVTFLLSSLYDASLELQTSSDDDLKDFSSGLQKLMAHIESQATIISQLTKDADANWRKTLQETLDRKLRETAQAQQKEIEEFHKSWQFLKVSTNSKKNRHALPYIYGEHQGLRQQAIQRHLFEREEMIKKRHSDYNSLKIRHSSQYNLLNDCLRYPYAHFLLPHHR
jgi:hypothetical protein